MNKDIEKTRLIWVVLIALFSGLLTGYIWQTLLVFLLGYIVWSLSHLFELSNWLEKGANTEKIPYASGLWGGIIGHVAKLKNQQKQSKKRQQKMIARFNEILRSFPYPTIVINGQSEIQWMDKDAAKMLDLSRKKDVGIRIGNIFRNHEFQEMLAQEDCAEFQIQSPHDANSILAIAISKLSKDTRILSIRDVSDRRRLEKLRKTFIANASHELRTPLTVINGYLEMLEQQPDLTSQNRQTVETISQHSKRMSVLITDLLTLSNLENSELQLNKMESIDMSELIQEVLNNTHDSNFRVVLEVSPDLYIHGIYSQLYSVVSNLIENALKYSEESVIVRWQLLDKKAQLEVIDQGQGISMEEQARLAEPFYRTKSAQSQQIQGTGLGLSIVKQAIIKNQGEFNIQSIEGQGSTFSATFEPIKNL